MIFFMNFTELSANHLAFIYLCCMVGNHFSINRVLFFLSIAMGGILLLPYWLSPGMFFDGVTYAAVANNWSQGIGEFWRPFYHHRDAPFMAHPPLLYVLLGVFYKLLGHAWWVEELYNFLTYAFTVILSIAIVQRIAGSTNKISFLPFFLLSITPLYSWAFRATLMDNTVTVFALLSVYLWLIYVQSSQFLFFVVAILSVFLGFMVKGPPALFPIIFLPAYILIFHRNSIKQWLIAIMPIVIIVMMFGLMIFLSEKARYFFEVYFSKQIVASIQGIESTDNGRWYLLQKLVLELLPMCFVSAIFIMIGSKKIKFSFSSWVTLFLLVALAGSLPLLISQKQRAFYLVPSLPFFAISLSLITVPYLNRVIQTVTSKAIKITGMTVFVLSIISVLSSIVTRRIFSNDASLVKDILAITHEVEPYSTIGCSSVTAVNWKWVAYAARYGGYTLDDQCDARYYLSMPDEVPKNDWQWQPLNLRLTRCKLYKKREPEGSLLLRPK